MDEEERISPEDEKLMAENAKLLALTEHPVWGAFCRMVADDMNQLDSITSLVLEDMNREELAREVDVRYHTIEAVKSYLNRTIERANAAQEDLEESKSDFVHHHD